jgi:uncharacterized protein YigE (DUF2233 family)
MKSGNQSKEYGANSSGINRQMRINNFFPLPGKIFYLKNKIPKVSALINFTEIMCY